MSNFGNGKTLKRTAVLGIILAAFAVFLLLRILIMQTFGYSKYQQKVIDQTTTETPVPAKRGTIYDRNGKVLASTVTAYRLFISPSGIAAAEKKNDDSDVSRVELIASGLSAIVGQEYYQKIIDQSKYTTKLDRTIKNGIYDKDTLAAIREFISKNGLHTEVYLGEESIRYYPYGTLGCHIIGFCSKDGVGLYGLEYQYDSVLSGTPGKIVTARDAYGNELEYDYESYIAAIDGSDIYTTIDIDVQRALDEECKQSLINTGSRNGTCGIVMDPYTGGILAMSVAPAFDLNDPWTLVDYYKDQLDEYAKENDISEDSEEYTKKQSELRQKMWANKAITEAFIPGSTFKILTSAMALENDVVMANNVYSVDNRCYCNGSGNLGYTTVGGVTIHCHSKHYAQSFAEGLMNSCNVTFINVGLDIGAERFYNAFKAFGYLEKTGIDLPGEGTSIMHKYENLRTVELATSAFGQNFKITGIQHIAAVNAVVNGGTLYQPFVVSKVVDRSGTTTYSHPPKVVRRVASAETCELLRTILEECVSGGYGGKNCYVAGYRVAAKTGTSEKVGDDKDLRIGSVMSFAPAEAPVATAFFMCDEPDPKYGSTYGSTVAAPYMQSLMQQILPVLGVEAKYTDAEKEDINRRVPDLVGWGVATLNNHHKDWCNLEENEFVIIGDGSVISAQVPEAGTYVREKGMKIYLYTSNAIKNESLATVPSVVGMTAEAATRTLINYGFNIVVVGSSYYENSTMATVQGQSVRPTTKLIKGSVITIYFDSAPDELDEFVGETENNGPVG